MKKDYTTYRLVIMLLILLCSMGMRASGTPVSDAQANDTTKGNLYLKFNLDVKRRNVLLMLVPRLYAIANGDRYYVGEAYGDYAYNKRKHKMDYREKLRIGTIKHQSTVFPNQLDYINPHIYDETLFNEYILSPFHPENKRFYKYTSMPLGDMEFVRFKPRVRNSTLTAGTAFVNPREKKIINATFNGEFDHINYSVDVKMDTVKNVPETCYLQSQFKLLGNNVTTSLFARYNCDAELPEKILDSNSPELMATVRKDTLSANEREAYDRVYTKEEVKDTVVVEERKKNIFEKVGDVLYDFLIRRPSYDRNGTELGMSPILDPLAIGYSGHKGVSYRIKFWGYWRIKNDRNRYVTLEPYVGYSFKQKQIYVNVPLRYTFDMKRKGWAELYVSNGNHISNSLLTQKIRDVEQRDTLDFEALNLEYFRNYEMSLKSNIPIGNYFHAGLAAVYHRRSAINMAKMRELGEKTIYHSFAPSLTFKYTPSSYVSYLFNYERSIPGFLGCDSKYERMELDAQFAVRYNALTSLNLHLGAGMYTNMESNDFVDYANFAENYLPDAWNDDWTGHFFLLNSDYYNASKYYIRANLSYESPILLCAHIPYVGYYLEKERLYISNVLMQKTLPYTELGYAFTTRYLSFGVFAGFFGTRFQEIGTKITLELFNRW